MPHVASVKIIGSITRIFLPDRTKQGTERRLPCSQRLSFILYWEILLRKPLFFIFIFFYWHEALRALKASGRDRWEPHFHAISF